MQEVRETLEGLDFILTMSLVMLVAIGPFLYAALVIAIPTWRLLDRLLDRQKKPGGRPKEWGRKKVL